MPPSLDQKQLVKKMTETTRKLKEIAERIKENDSRELLVELDTVLKEWNDLIAQIEKNGNETE